MVQSAYVVLKEATSIPELVLLLCCWCVVDAVLLMVLLLVQSAYVVLKEAAADVGVVGDVIVFVLLC